ncbi:hypothetical protein [Fimbriiglobus ruber]|uniref:Uncharacterized protein n=1 Tax=Fimbriiglobus ruber TaxID=1908690 RepID=A0A225DQB3_9BACT|nr:hypothetical protein [Fimbriiglobus ruber]OWK43481.1 hypothetical protein FRUB_03080 [Fimbriiglobus ruber]
MRVFQLHPDLTEPADMVRGLRYRPDGQVFCAFVGEMQAARGVYWWDLRRDRLDNVLEFEGEEREQYPDPAVSTDLEMVARAVVDDIGERVELIDTWAQPYREMDLRWEGPRDDLVPEYDPGDAAIPLPVSCVAFGPDGETLYAGLWPGAVPFHWLSGGT